MDATTKDAALMDKCGCFGFALFLVSLFFSCFSTRQVQEAEWN